MKLSFGISETKKYSERPIGIFDSGVGGLTVLKALKNIMPYENYIYFGDTLNMPYGSKDKDTIKQYAYNIVNFFNSLDPKIIIAACGTVSSFLPELDFNSKNKDVIGVIDSACIAAAQCTRNKKIGIMCTEATALSGSYAKSIQKINSNLKVYSQGCPELVPLIEDGMTTLSCRKLKNAIESYVQSLIKKDVDTIILGCTHYPIIKNAIKEVVGDNISLIDTGEETAKFIKKYICTHNLESSKNSKGSQRFLVSANPNHFSHTAQMFLNYDEKLYIEQIKI